MRLLYYETFNSGTTVSGVTILKKDKMSALKGTNIGCTITLNNTIGPDYSALNVTWTHNYGSNEQDTMLQSSSGEASKMFTSVLTIDSNEFSDSGSYCCSAAVIGSGDLKMMNDCITLNVLGKLMLHVTIKYSLIRILVQISPYQDSTLI